jgi:hypothetical protein
VLKEMLDRFFHRKTNSPIPVQQTEQQPTTLPPPPPSRTPLIVGSSADERIPSANTTSEPPKSVSELFQVSVQTNWNTTIEAKHSNSTYSLKTEVEESMHHVQGTS